MYLGIYKHRIRRKKSNHLRPDTNRLMGTRKPPTLQSDGGKFLLYQAPARQGIPSPLHHGHIMCASRQYYEKHAEGGLGGKTRISPQKRSCKKGITGRGARGAPGGRRGQSPRPPQTFQIITLFLCGSRQIMSLPLSPLSAEPFRAWGESRLQSARNGGASIEATTYAPALCSTSLQANFKAGRGL